MRAQDRAGAGAGAVAAIYLCASVAHIRVMVSTEHSRVGFRPLDVLEYGIIAPTHRATAAAIEVQVERERETKDKGDAPPHLSGSLM